MKNKERTNQQLVKEIKVLRKCLRESLKFESICEDAKKELEIQAWGLEKANRGIKLLYKELEQKNEEIKKLSEIKSDFVSNVSHELRTPLSIIKEGISSIMDRIPGEINEEQAHILDISMRNIDRLARLIDNLLDISRIEAGKLELKQESVDMKELITRVLLSFTGKAKDKGLEIGLNIPDKKIEAYADGDNIIQVFNNLIDNALKFTEKGHIEITIREEGNEVHCAVSDTGIGILKEDIPKVFSKFQQFDRMPGPGKKGFGLGLSITKKIIELHNGRIQINSKRGKGTKIVFTLPKYNC